jgi:hypothetical protein
LNDLQRNTSPAVSPKKAKSEVFAEAASLLKYEYCKGN